ncbi:hypothetical protein DFH06DRAFT_1305907 [Mycena polygramma]|nr:hypothetical protein DFH06DRAFT_1305907 [Mycena polygramma]
MQAGESRAQCELVDVSTERESGQMALQWALPQQRATMVILKRFGRPPPPRSTYAVNLLFRKSSNSHALSARLNLAQNTMEVYRNYLTGHNFRSWRGDVIGYCNGRGCAPLIDQTHGNNVQKFCVNPRGRAILNSEYGFLSVADVCGATGKQGSRACRSTIPSYPLGEPRVHQALDIPAGARARAICEQEWMQMVGGDVCGCGGAGAAVWSTGDAHATSQRYPARIRNAFTEHTPGLVSTS